VSNRRNSAGHLSNFEIVSPFESKWIRLVGKLSSHFPSQQSSLSGGESKRAHTRSVHLDAAAIKFGAGESGNHFSLRLSSCELGYEEASPFRGIPVV